MTSISFTKVDDIRVGDVWYDFESAGVVVTSIFNYRDDDGQESKDFDHPYIGFKYLTGKATWYLGAYSFLNRFITREQLLQMKLEKILKTFEQPEIMSMLERMANK